MSPYSSSVMIGYIAFNQSILFLSTFLTAGLGVQEGVRSGAISLDLIRPVNFFLYTISQEAGRIAYNFFYRSLPIGLIFALTVGFSYPHHFVTYLWTFFSIALAAYIGLSLYYMVGISSVWTTEVRWAHFLNITLISGLGGTLIPIDMLPEPLASFALLLPFAGAVYYPSMIYLEQLSPAKIGFQAGWAVILTLISLALTAKARRRLEIQGG